MDFRALCRILHQFEIYFPMVAAAIGSFYSLTIIQAPTFHYQL